MTRRPYTTRIVIDVITGHFRGRERLKTVGGVSWYRHV